MTSVLVVGEAMIELTSVGDHRLAWSFAGDTLNCAAAIRAACGDARVDYLTGLGDDSVSQEFVRFCSQLGVDVSHSPVVVGRNLGLYWISTENGERDFRYWRNESAARHVLTGGLRIPQQAYDAVVLSNITLAVAGDAAGSLVDEMKGAKNRGALLAFDLNYRANLWPSVAEATRAAEAALAVVDIVVASEEDISALWSENAEAFSNRAAASGVAETVITRGPGPITVSTSDRRWHIDPPEVQAVDTTGAGDAFMGTYVAGRLCDQTPATAALEAATVASNVVQEHGALTYLLDR